MPKPNEIEVNRHYRCRNDECAAEIVITQMATDDFVRLCPFCEQETMGLVSGDCKISMVMDLTKAKTVGSVAEKNRARMEKNGEITKDQAESWSGKKKAKRPWWRKTDKINFDILKNPKRYIQTGKI